MAERIRNAMSIDVEDYFQVSAFAPHIRREDWDTLPCRVERNVDVILGLLDEANAKATFFTLGWIAERYPQVVRRIVDDGHELASHGYGHQRASGQAYSRRPRWRRHPRLSRAELLHQPEELVGGRGTRKRRIRIQFEHLSGTPRPLRHARRAAFPASPQW